MPVIDLTDKEARGSGQLNKFSVKADGRDESAFLYEANVVFVIANTAEAEIVERLIPGAKETYSRATDRDDWKSQQTINPDIEGARITICKASDGTLAMRGGAEIVACTLRASKRAVTLTVRCRCAGQTEQVATLLTKLLRCPVELLIEGAQQLLPLRPRTGPSVSVGAVVVAKDDEGNTVWGRVDDIDEETDVVLLDTFADVQVPVAMASITTAWALAQGAETETALKAYCAALKKKKVAPNYRALTVAVGEHYAVEAAEDGQHRLIGKVIDRAVELAVQDAKGNGETRTVLRPKGGARTPRGNVAEA